MYLHAYKLIMTSPGALYLESHVVCAIWNKPCRDGPEKKQEKASDKEEGDGTTGHALHVPLL